MLSAQERLERKGTYFCLASHSSPDRTAYQHLLA